MAVPELPQALLRHLPEEDGGTLLQEARLSGVPDRDARGRHPGPQGQLGMTGTGKSRTGTVIAKELATVGGVSVLVPDGTGDFAQFRSRLARAPPHTPMMGAMTLDSVK